MVLIGPAAVGKSTIGPLLAASVGSPFVDLDERAGRYYSEAGMSLDDFRTKIDAVGYVEAHRWWQPARVNLRRVLEDYPRFVVAVGAGHTHFEDRPFADAAASALECDVVVLLLPDLDRARSVALLRQRSVASKRHDWRVGDIDYLDVRVRSDQNHRLADHVIHLWGRTPSAATHVALVLETAPGAEVHDRRRSGLPASTPIGRTPRLRRSGTQGDACPALRSQREPGPSAAASSSVL